MDYYCYEDICICKWTNQDVLNWFLQFEVKKNLKIPNINNILYKEMNGINLLHLKERDLQIILDIKNMGHRKKIIRDLNLLRVGCLCLTNE